MLNRIMFFKGSYYCKLLIQNCILYNRADAYEQSGIYMEIKVLANSLAIITFLITSPDAAPGKDFKQMIFEEQRIEGKIRRPQLVLIKAEQRPEFKPMVIQSSGALDNIINSVNDTLVERSPYKGPFQFEGTKIRNYDP